MKTFTSLLLSIITIVALGFTQKANAQSCTINMSGCPPTIMEACATTTVSGLDGTYVSWTPPAFSLNCHTSDPSQDYSFYIEFNLPEVKNSCWVYNRVQRVGSNNLNLWQSTGSGNPYFITPLQFFNAGADINTKFLLPSNKNFTWTLQVLDEQMNILASDSKFIPNSGLYTINLPSSIPDGAYYLKFLFSGNGNNQCYVDRIYYNAFLINGADCAGGINFVASSTYSPGDFFPVGSTSVTYTATYTPTSGSPITQTCSFNVVVNKVSITNISTTPTTCNGNNGSITFTASSANTSANHLEYSLDGTTWYPISGGNVVTTTPQAGTTTTSWQATMTIPSLHAQTYNLQVRDTQKACTPASQSVTVSNTADTQAPTFTRPADITIYTDANCAYNASPSVTGDVTNESDNCSTGLNATYSDVINNGTCTGSKIITRTWHLVDNNDNAAADQVQTITILDNIVPAWTTTAGSLNRTVECNDADGLTAAQALAPVATDNCSSVTYTKTSGTFVPGTCGATGTYTNTWVAKDACLNTSAVFTQKITIIDTKAPTFVSFPADVTVECNAVPVAATLTATDNCDAAPVVTYKEVRTDGVCPSTYTLTRTWTATDACGNSASKTQVIKVQDTTAPVLSEAPADVTVECNAVPVAATLTATDNCD
ncbi:MAG: HYR domain-containing protein, partial [Bacteroidota bacterium]|nr:HYR domain-containing protein [Bacteroidota bacterium]